MEQLLQVSMRYQAVYIPDAAVKTATFAITPTTATLVTNMAELGFGVAEDLLHALQHTTPAFHLQLLEALKDLAGVNKNWTPLVRGWDVPTGETRLDHFITSFANAFKSKIPGTVLACGHMIPAGTFPLERYNGCPFCGTPFEFAAIENYGQNSRQKVLELWTDKHLAITLTSLLSARTALDATQQASLKTLLQHQPLPEVAIAMKETLMLAIDILIESGMEEKAQALFRTPADVMRYLWFKHTGHLQILQPKVVALREARNSGHIVRQLDKRSEALAAANAKLRLKYNRHECLRVAKWLNGINMDLEQMCEIMHPKRAMWVRFIRALRLIEYGKRKGFERLGALMEKFAKQDYEVWQGWVNHFRTTYDSAATFELLKQRPGSFARALFANMLWFGPDATLEAFAEVAGKVPARLLVSLAMYADQYFDGVSRVVKPLGGGNKQINGNKLTAIYQADALKAIKTAVADMCMAELGRRFASQQTEARTIFIDPMLFKIPLAIGDRAGTVQDLPSALMGTVFPVEGDRVRLFMQWGVGLPAQHLDMDLTAVVAYDDRIDYCSFQHLTTIGCQHSGDIRAIPEKKGTAEYIELDLQALKAANARYVTFTCNAYSVGALSPNLVVGWMNSANPMKVSEKSGVAYDPACVQHQVRVTSALTKGLVFGVLNVATKEITWMEMEFGGQLGTNVDLRTVRGMLDRLQSKMTIGELLMVKARVQQLTLLGEATADENYTAEWARDTAAVTQLLID
jgi:hypothetical protein